MNGMKGSVRAGTAGEVSGLGEEMGSIVALRAAEHSATCQEGRIVNHGTTVARGITDIEALHGRRGRL